METLRIIFAGTEYFSAEHLNALIMSMHKIVAVITKPDKSKGRGQKIHLSPVKKLSQKYCIPIFQPETLTEENIQKKILELKADMMIIIAYGKIIPKKIIDMFSMGCINLHPSLLPRWRGATPIQSAIAHGDKETGITIIEINNKIDSGDIIYSKKCNISVEDTTLTLSLKLIKIGIESLLKTIQKIIDKKITKIPQNEKYSKISRKIYKKDALLNWNKPAKNIERLIRSFNPWPICYFKISTIIIKVWQARVIPIHNKNYSIGEIILVDKEGIKIQTQHEILDVKIIQLPNKKSMKVQEILLSQKKLFKNGTIL